MKRILAQALRASGLIISLAAPVSVQAFGAPAFDAGGTRPVGITTGCNFNPFNSPNGEGGGQPPEADVRFFVASVVSPTYVTAGGSAWQNGNVVTSGRIAITPAHIQEECAFEPGSVTIVSQNGADNGTYAADDFMGITFIATPAGDTQAYTYTIGMQGATSPVVVTSRVAYTPPSDTTAPTALSLVRTTPTATFTNADSLTWTITFDEDVTNVDPTDFTVSGTSATLAVTGSGAIYSLTLSGGDLASLNGVVTIGLAGSPSIQDVATNPLSGGISGTNESTYSVDNGQDSLLLTTPSSTVSGEFQVTGVFTAVGPAPAPNAVSPGVAVLSNVQIMNGTVTGSSGFSGNTLTFNVTPSGPGAVNVVFPAAAAMDGAGNPTQASNTLSVTDQDNTPPVVTVPDDISVFADAGLSSATVTYAAPTATDNVGVTSGPSLTAGLASGGAFPIGVTTVTYDATDAQGNIGSASFTVTVTDGENPVVGVPANIAVGTDAGQSTAIVTYAAPTATDNVSVTSGPTLMAGLASGAAFPIGMTTVTYDASDAQGNTGSASFTVTVTDGENPVVTVPDDISVFADAGLSSATVTYAAPTATDNVGVTSGPSLTAGLASGGAFPMGITTVTYQALDAENNTGSASFTVTVTDGEAPVVTVPADIIVSTDPGLATAVVTYPAVTATDNVAVTAGPDLTVGLLSGATFPLGTTVVTYQATDGDTNIGTASFNVTVEDNEAPVIRPIGAVSFEADPSGTREITFSAIVDDNVDTGIAPVFRLDGNVITPPYDFPVGLNAITINATDTEGNAAVEVIFNLTIVAGQAPDVPDITTSVINADRSMTIGGTAETDSTVRVTFPDTTFQEVTATGGAFIVTSAALMTGGTVTVTSTDDRGYTSLAATVDLFPDYDQPTVAITGAPTRVIDESPFTVTITFSENVTGFVLGDIGVTGANVAAFAGTGAVYTAEITPIAGEAVVLSVAGGVAQDDFANLNVASDVISIENAALTETEEMITQVMQSRNAALIATQPRIGRFLLGGQFGSFNLNVTQGVGNFDLTTSSERPVWLAGQGRWSTEGALETSYFNLAVGGHIAMTENVLLGAMAQFDSTVSDEAVMTFESTGWLVGPYAVLRMADQPLVFSASYLMGQTTNTLSPFGTYEDEFSSDRSILTLGVTGKMELTSVTLIPRLDLAHVTDESEAYTDGDSNLVRAQTVTMTDATIGLDFVMPIDVANGALELIGGIGATSSRFDNGVEETDDTRGQTELGFRYTMESGGLVTARATYDGLGQDDYEAVGAEVSFEISF